MIKRINATLAILALVIGGFLLAFSPNTHTRLYDANLRPLALTQAEAWCVGKVGIGSSFKENDPQVDECQAESALATEVDIARVPTWFCEGVVAGGWPYTADDCVGIIDGRSLWPLLHGGLTDQWNSGFPRPKAVGGGIVAPQRGADRGDSGRQEGGRFTP